MSVDILRAEASRLLMNWAHDRMMECLAAGDIGGFAEWMCKKLEHHGRMLEAIERRQGCHDQTL